MFAFNSARLKAIEESLLAFHESQRGINLKLADEIRRAIKVDDLLIKEIRDLRGEVAGVHQSLSTKILEEYNVQQAISDHTVQLSTHITESMKALEEGGHQRGLILLKKLDRIKKQNK